MQHELHNAKNKEESWKQASLGYYSHSQKKKNCGRLQSQGTRKHHVRSRSPSVFLWEKGERHTCHRAVESNRNRSTLSTWITLIHLHRAIECHWIRRTTFLFAREPCTLKFTIWPQGTTFRIRQRLLAQKQRRPQHQLTMLRAINGREFRAIESTILRLQQNRIEKSVGDIEKVSPSGHREIDGQIHQTGSYSNFNARQRPSLTSGNVADLLTLIPTYHLLNIVTQFGTSTGKSNANIQRGCCTQTSTRSKETSKMSMKPTSFEDTCHPKKHTRPRRDPSHRHKTGDTSSTVAHLSICWDTFL